MNISPSLPALVAALFAIPLPIFSAQFNISDASGLENLPALQPGDEVILADGLYNEVDAIFNFNGTASDPVLVYAQNPGEVEFTGGTRIIFRGSYATVSGLKFDSNGGPIQKEGIVKFDENSTFITLNNCLFRDFNTTGEADANWIFIEGYDNKVTYCSLEGKTSLNSTIFIKPTEGSSTRAINRNHVISYCDFGPRTVIGNNGYETIRISDSSRQDFETKCLIEKNYFFQAISAADASEAEVISNKSRGNIYRGNVFEDCDGQITLRHGRDCLVEENCFLGTGGNRESGIRVIGTGHIIRNNYIENVNGTNFRAAIVVMDGEYGRTDNRYEGVENCIIDNNVIVNCKSSFNFGLNAGFDDPPRDITLTNNRVHNTTGGDIFTIESDVKFSSVSGNVIYSQDNTYGDTALVNAGTTINPLVDTSLPFTKAITRDEVGHNFNATSSQDPQDGISAVYHQDAAGDYLTITYPVEAGLYYTVAASENLTDWSSVVTSQQATTDGIQQTDILVHDLLSGGHVTSAKKVFFRTHSSTTASTTGQLAYEEVGGQVVIEAENYNTTDLNGDVTEWTVSTQETGSVGSYIETTTGDTATWDNGAEVTYTVHFSSPGTFYFHPRVRVDDGSSDSVFIGVGDTLVGVTNTGTTSGWAWDNNEGEEIVIPSAGLHDITLRRRENNLRIDRFVLTTSPSASFSGDGPQESARIPLP